MFVVERRRRLRRAVAVGNPGAGEVYCLSGDRIVARTLLTR
jgi:protein involved in ribonucleotide reduction